MEVDPLVVKLQADHRQYMADLKKSGTFTASTLSRKERDVRKLEKQFRKSSNGISTSLKGIAGTLAATFTGRELIGILDSFTRFQNQLKVAGVEGSNLKAVQDALFASAQRYGVELETMGTLYGRVAQASSELGISQSELLLFTDRVSAAVKVQGGNAQAASGALLQMSQALQSGTVRAEEYNSINEGLYPVLEAVAAGSERFGGSIATLRKEVMAGTVSSREFFNSFIAGSPMLEAKAGKATLTLSASFATLTNAITVYFGEADKANGASAALSQAIEKLAKNIDVVIPALAMVASFIGVRYVAGAVAASGATQALIAHLAIATTSLSGTALAARSAGAAMLGVFGGPIGAAILAVGAALYYTANQAMDTAAAVRELDASSKKAADDLTDLERRAKAAGVELKGTGDAAKSAQSGLTGLNHTISSSIDFYNRLTKSARLAAVAIANTDLQKAESRRRDLREQLDSSARNVTGAAEGVVVDQGAVSDAFYNVHNGKKLDQEIKDLRARVAALSNLSDDDYTKLFPDTPSSAAPSEGGKKTKASKGRSGTSAADIEARFNQDMERLNQEVLQAKHHLADEAGDRAELELQMLNQERDSRLADIAANTDLSEDQKNAQRAIIAQLYGQKAEYDKQGGILVAGTQGLLSQAVRRDEAMQTEREAADLQSEQIRAQQAVLRYDYDLARTQSERRDIALRMVSLFHDAEIAALEAQKTATGINDADKAILQVKIDALKRIREAETKTALLDTAGPLEAYLDEIPKTTEEFNEKVEQHYVSAIKGLNSGLADAIVNGENLGDVLEDTGKRFLAQLIEIGLQLLIIKPLMESLGGGMGGGLGGLFGAIGSIFGGGRASGGPVSAGQVYRINESGQEYFRPSVDGSIVPAGRVNAMTQSGGGGSVQGAIRIYLSDDIDARIESVSGPIAVEVVRQTAPAVIDAAVSETFNRSGKPRL